MGKLIKSTGPVPASVMVVAERPGKEESYRGRVLCGPSGKELDRYLLTESGVDRSNVYCTNLVKDYREGQNPEEWEVERDWQALLGEIQRVQPRYILALGLWSARAFLGHGTEMDWANGLHFPITWEIGKFTVMPVIHTAAGLHQPSAQVRIAHGFRQFGKLIHGQPLPTGHLQPLSQCTYSDSVIQLRGESVIAMDTEGTVERPWGLSYSVRAGVASVQHGRRHRNWRCDAVDNATVVLHGAMHDLPVLRRLGVRPRRWECTLLKAALLGTEPHGLKALARRYCGMRMREYDDVVAEARREKALEYLSRVVDWATAEVST